MAPNTIRVVIAVVFILHGIGHIMGILSAAGLFVTEQWHSRSWLLTDALGDVVARVIAGVIWLVVVIGFLGVGMGMLGWLVPQAWWRPLAVASSIISLIGLALFWNAFAAFFNKAGAIGVDVATLVAVLLAHWPPTDIT